MGSQGAEFDTQGIGFGRAACACRLQAAWWGRRPQQAHHWGSPRPPCSSGSTALAANTTVRGMVLARIRISVVDHAFLTRNPERRCQVVSDGIVACSHSSWWRCTRKLRATWRTVPGVGMFSEALPLTAGGASTRWLAAGVAAFGQASLASCTTSWLPCTPMHHVRAVSLADPPPDSIVLTSPFPG